MARVAILYGLLLILIGVAGYVASGAASVTALIPAFIGLLAVVLGGLALRESWHRHAMHAVSALALLAVLGTVRGLMSALLWIGGNAPARPGAVVSQSLTALLSIVFVLLAVRSFVRARRSSS
jgi:hypothetical protein